MLNIDRKKEIIIYKHCISFREKKKQILKKIAGKKYVNKQYVNKQYGK